MVQSFYNPDCFKTLIRVDILNDTVKSYSVVGYTEGGVLYYNGSKLMFEETNDNGHKWFEDRDEADLFILMKNDENNKTG